MVLPELFDNLEKHSVFIAGPPDFVRDCQKVCAKLGARPELTYRENYYPQVAAETAPRERLTT